jgi:hypothetical protein
MLRVQRSICQLFTFFHLKSINLIKKNLLTNQIKLSLMKNLNRDELQRLASNNEYFEPIQNDMKHKLSTTKHYDALNSWINNHQNIIFNNYIEKYHDKRYLEAIGNRLVKTYKLPIDYKSTVVSFRFQI